MVFTLGAEVAIGLTTQPLAGALGRVLRAFRNLAWRRSDGCVAVGHDMAALIAQAGVPAEKISTIPNWAPAGLEPQPPQAGDDFRRNWKLEGKFVIAYSGNLGRVHDLAPVLEVATLLRAQTRLAFVFIGAGAQHGALTKMVRERGLTNVHFHPPQPRVQLAAALAVGDLHLVTILPGCESLVFPSKLCGIAAVGRPVIFVGPRLCEVARLVKEFDFGVAFTRDEVGALAAALQGLAADPVRCIELGKHAAEFSRTRGRLEHALAAWSQRLAREVAC